MNDQEALLYVCHFPIVAKHYTENEDRKNGKDTAMKIYMHYELLNMNCIILMTLYISEMF